MPHPKKPAEDRSLKLISCGLSTVIGATFTFCPHLLEGFLLGLAAFVFIWKTGLIDVIWV